MRGIDETRPFRRPESPGSGRRKGARPGERGSSLVELALVLPLLLILLFAVIDFGHLVQTRLVMANVSREGGSIASRQDSLDANLPGLLLASASPLALGGADGRVVITRIVAGTSAALPNPRIAKVLASGSYAAGSGVVGSSPTLGLTPNVYNHLVFNAANGVADISAVTVVEVFYLYRPITPLSNLVIGLLNTGGGGVPLGSRAVF